VTTQPNAEWEEEYNPLTLGDDDETLLHPWDKVRDLPEATVWSVVQDREGRLVAVAGRLPNTQTVDYAVTEKPWTTGKERGYWLPLDAERELGYTIRNTTGWTIETCDNNPDCDGADPVEHTFPPEGQSVIVVRTDEAREVGSEDFHTVTGGEAGTVVIVDPDIHMVAVMLWHGRRLWIDPENLTNAT
jgi:hypothetical protein